MDKSRYRGRAFHSVGEPYVKRKHCRFTHAAHEYEHQSPCEHRTAEEDGSRAVLENVADAVGCLRADAINVIETFDRNGCQLGEIECSCII